MDDNTLYLAISIVIAIVIIIGLLKSDIFKANITNEGIDIEAGKNKESPTGSNHVDNIIKDSTVEISGQNNRVTKVSNSSVKISK